MCTQKFLDTIVKHFTLDGYSLVARHDRSDGRLGGGIAAFAISAIDDRVNLIHSSDDAERLWPMVHAEQGPHFVGDWYKSLAPGGNGTVATFKAEYSALGGMSLGSIVLGSLTSTTDIGRSTPITPAMKGELCRTRAKTLGYSKTLQSLREKTPFQTLCSQTRRASGRWYCHALRIAKSSSQRCV